MRLTVALLFMVFASGRDAAGHSAPAALGPAPEFRTDARSYTLHAGRDSYDVSIGVTFTNLTGDTVYFPRCKMPEFELRKRVPGGWAGAWEPSAYFACKGQPIVVPSRGRWRTRLDIRAFYPGSRWGGPQFRVDSIPGTYRLRWERVETPAAVSLPEEERVSNEFALRAEPRPAR